MNDLPSRLAASISTIMERFKLRPDGPYEGLSLVETSIIAHVAAAARPPVQGDIGGALGVPKTTMTSAVSRLESKNLILRVPSSSDGRARELTLTKDGRALAASLAAAQIESSRLMLEALSSEDREILVHLIEKIAQKVGDLD